VNSIRTKLTLWYTAMMTLIVIVFAASSYGLLYLNIINNLKKNIINFSQVIITDYIEVDPANYDINIDSGDDITLNERLQLQSHSIRIIDQEKNIVVQHGILKTQIKPNETKISSSLLANGTSTSFIKDKDENSYIYFVGPIVKDNQTVGVIELSRPVDEAFQALRQLLIILIIGITISIVISLMIGYLLSRQMLAYIDELIDNVQSITVSRDFEKRLPIPTDYHDELTRLAATFNQMLASMQQEYNREKDFTANASHDLRTPLTIIQGNVDLALKKPNLTPSQHTKILSKIKQEVKRMSAIINDLLELSKLDKTSEMSQIINLPDIINDLIGHFSQKAKEKNVVIEYKKPIKPDQINIKGNYQQIKRLLNNLIENAIKYNVVNGLVTVKTYCSKNDVWVEIIDTGIGIEPEDLPYIFDRHWQSNKSQSGVKQGFGLGLSIVKQIIDNHSGEIHISPAGEKGTKVKIKLPQSLTH